MNKFCKDVLEFLKSKYSDSYEFKIELAVKQAESYSPRKNAYNAILFVKFNNSYTLKITDDYMSYIFKKYLSGDFIEEQNQYVWQKVLIDIIEDS